ncbi:Transcription factor bHLH53 like [Actinidia chinensis var. chinensis]|uniref:Transcription factor bHLH53 like n=1 Tax=Actinidia chinensis var. chinensis TaxID=1590841 RepID=A0A2R6Q5T0_ACTCC|nr:Transcription factor bHLH53 like [Actinidia chinensis var. chinensis]
MALSYYSNWDTRSSSFPQAQVLELPPMAMDLIGLQEHFTYPDACFDPLLLDPNQYSSFLSENYYPHFDNSTNISHSSDLFPPQPQELIHSYSYPYPYPKRQKEDNYHAVELELTVPPCLVDDGFIMPNPPDLTLPAEFSGPPGTVVVKRGGSRSLSAQSIAARQRRRKITDKTQELGKLIPGVHKMNTAEMFQAAFKYIKYLQAQVGVLQSIVSIQGNEEPLHTQELHALATSPNIQEKLYSSENCLVPKQFVQTLAHDHEFQDLDQLIQNRSG